MGFFDKIINTIGLGNTTQTEFENTLTRSIDEYKKIAFSFYSIDVGVLNENTDVVSKWDDSKKIAFIIYLTSVVTQNDLTTEYNETKAAKHYMAMTYIHTLLRSKLKMSQTEVQGIYTSFLKNIPPYYNNSVFNYPMGSFFKQIETNFSAKDLPLLVKEVLTDITKQKTDNLSQKYKEQVKLIEKINAYLYKSSNDEDAIKPIYFLGNDGLKEMANQLLEAQGEEDKKYWYQLLTHAQKASGSKPSQKFLSDSKSIIDELGSDKFKKVTHEWFNFIIGLKETETSYTQTYANREYIVTSILFLDPLNVDVIKGFVWMSSWFHDNATIQIISKLAERCYKKIPSKGPAAAAIGNACLFTLYASKGLDGIAQLSRLKLKIKQSSTLDLIDKYIEESAKKLRLSPVEVEDLAVDDFKLKENKLHYELDEYTCVLELTGIGKSQLKWYKKDGSEQKTAPKTIVEKYAAKLKKIKETQKQIDQTTSSQKERIDRMMRSNRVVTMEYFKEKYLEHGLLSFVINKVIYNFSKDDEQRLAIFINGKWIGLDYKELSIENYITVTLWHPVTSSTAEVKEWRQFLMDSQIQQPFKQAYREIYLLTDAELNTRTYSNRMASHILKQHQYVTLAKGRNWRAKLIGAWDGGDQDTACLPMYEFGLQVEYWINALNAEDQYNPTGIWNYVTTDQIRFVNLFTHEVMELIDVPAIAFSEAMRDIDLFVGVASVGNDPTWSDSGGLPTYRDYWQAYSFGDLSEIAKNRKEILQGLIPRLKIASVTSIEDKFVVVKGKLRTYKIHIGSTNILMEPNDQYLCIVPDRSKKNEPEKLFLPFEGDGGLSVILSKAMLLAADDKITDSTITSQINRR